MKFFSVIAALFTAVMAADPAAVISSASVIRSHVDNMARLVDAWTQQNGLIAALPIQGQYQPLINAVGALNTLLSAPSAVGTNDVNNVYDSYTNLGTSISHLLTSLSTKAADFKGVGAGQIIANDIQQLSPQAFAAESKMALLIPKLNAGQSSTVVSIQRKVSVAVKSAASAFNVNVAVPSHILERYA